MRFIAHRGNVFGRNSERENTPSYIDEALYKYNHDAEIDVWSIDNKLYLGHDGPDTEISLTFLLYRKTRLWCHAKNLEALTVLLEHGLHCFWHNTDDYTLTSQNIIWAYPGKSIQLPHCVCVMPERMSQDTYTLNQLQNCYAICTDDIHMYTKLLTAINQKEEFID